MGHSILLDTGVDIIEIGRVQQVIDRWGPRFLDRVFTPAEQTQCAGSVPSLAARFAAKEAAVKTLGTGIGEVSWQEVETISGQKGKPYLRLHGNANRIATEKGLRNWSVSLSHSRDYAVAMVIAWAASPSKE